MGRRPGSKSRCSYCGGIGHNRRGCAHVKKAIQENPNSWEARRRTGYNKRSCGYCGEEGHTVRTCSELKSDMNDYKKLNVKFQAMVKKGLEEAGLGAGTIVKNAIRGKNAYYMVTKVNWEQINVADWAEHGVAIRGHRKSYGTQFLAERINVSGLSKWEKESSWYTKAKFQIPHSVYNKIGIANGTNSNGEFEIISPVKVVGANNMKSTDGSGFFTNKKDRNTSSKIWWKVIRDSWNSDLNIAGKSADSIVWDVKYNLRH